MFVSHFYLLSRTSLCLTACVRVASFPCFFYHTPSICPPLFSPHSPPALIMPHFAPLPRSTFFRPLSVTLAGIQGVKVGEEIDSKKDSHVMWRGTKEDPGGLGRLSATCFIPKHPAPPFPYTYTHRHTHTNAHTCTHHPKTIPGPSTSTPEDLHAALHALITFSVPAKISASISLQSSL